MTDRALDRIDRGILVALQKDARISNKELAAKVGLAPSSCLERVRRLTERGLVRGYHADVDPSALGIGLRAIIFISLRDHSRQTVEDLRDRVLSLPEVVSWTAIGGRQDVLVHVAVRDTDHLKDLRMDQLAERAAVARIETALVFEHHTSPVLPDYL